MPAIVRHLFVTSAAVALLTGCAQQDTRPPEAAAEKRAKNIILFIGDGMGVSTVTAARIFDGQSQGKAGEEHVLGLFSSSHLAYVAERREDSTQPTLAEMTAKAIELLSANEDGYLLLIEGGRIDHGHHIGKPAYALLETQAFARAVETALAMVDPDETLILVTADHSHVFTMGGYATRGNPILGLVVGNDKSGEPKSGPEVAADGRPYRTLQYANGPGAVTRLPRPTPELGVHSLAQALVPMRSVNIDGSVTNDETHAGEDVALYATGPGSEQVRGVIEQNRIFDIMIAAFGFREQAN